MPTDTTAQDDLAQFAKRCRAFLDQHATEAQTDRSPDPQGTKRLATNRKFQHALAEAGLAGIVYPREYGGAGLTRAHDRVWRDIYSAYPNMSYEFTISHGMCLPMLAEYGTHEQKLTYMADNISGRTLWCQMFSEPGAGSDVASLQTKAERDGDVWVINGQKVWTTLAHLSDYGIIIARTNPNVAKHAGISMFIVPMHAPGIEVRPIHQIDGASHFNEVFFTDMTIPIDNLLGDLNNGWNMATAMLMYERVAIGTGTSGGIRHDRADQLISEAKTRGLSKDLVLRQKLMRIYAMETCQSLVSMRTRAELKAGKTPGPGVSIGKLASAIIMNAVRDVSMEIVGASGVAWENEADARWQRGALTSLQGGIAGGTNEIQRNIIGDRVLGLPRDISVDKGVPFKDLKVGTQPSQTSK